MTATLKRPPKTESPIKPKRAHKPGRYERRPKSLNRSAQAILAALERCGPLTIARIKEETGQGNPRYNLANMEASGKLAMAQRGGVRLYFIPGPGVAADVERAWATLGMVDAQPSTANATPKTNDAKQPRHDWTAGAGALEIERRRQARLERLRERADRLRRPCYAFELESRYSRTSAACYAMLRDLKAAGLLGEIHAVPRVDGNRVRVTTLYYLATNRDSEALALSWVREAEAMERAFYGQRATSEGDDQDSPRHDDAPAAGVL